MALGMVGRKSFISFVIGVGALAQGCFTTKSDDDSSKGCTKDTDCAAGRICNSGTCMDANSSGGSGAGGTGAILSGGTGGGSGAASGGTSGTSATCSSSDPITCPTADSMTLCLNGTEQTLTCDYACTTLLIRATGPCVDPDGCNCGDPLDTACSDGVDAYCSCVSDSSTPCDPNDPNNDPTSFYLGCHANDPSDQEDTDFLKCLAMQVMTDSSGNGTIDCQAAATACSPPDASTGGSGGTGGTAGASGTSGTGGSAP